MAHGKQQKQPALYFCENQSLHTSGAKKGHTAKGACSACCAPACASDDALHIKAVPASGGMLGLVGWMQTTTGQKCSCTGSIPDTQPPPQNYWCQPIWKSWISMSQQSAMDGVLSKAWHTPNSGISFGAHTWMDGFFVSWALLCVAALGSNHFGSSHTWMQQSFSQLCSLCY
jgi:hypothetical protein